MATYLSHTGEVVRWAISWFVLGLFGLACILPCIDGGPPIDSSGDVAGSDLFGERGRHLGLELLLLGWAGGNNGVPWSANVFLALGLGCLVLRRHRAATVLGVIASILGLTTWWARRYDTMMVGYYFWQASHFVLAGGALCAIRTCGSRRRGSQTEFGNQS
jgi:hypothetical protein